MEIRQCYDILEISPDASDEEIRRQHRDLVNIWHPDRFSHTPRLRKKAERKLAEINTAYDAVMAFRSSGAQTQPPDGKKPFAKTGETEQSVGNGRFSRPHHGWAAARPRSVFWKLIIPLIRISLLPVCRKCWVKQEILFI